MSTSLVRPEARMFVGPVDPPFVVRPGFDAEELLNGGFENGQLNGWSNGTVQSVVKRSGNWALQANAPARAFTGLVVGHEYTLRGWHSTTGASWIEYFWRFTAASTSMSRTLNVAGTRYWDDVELIHHVPAETSPYAPLPVSEGRVTLDENYSPYGTSSVEVPLTDLEVLERIDPRDGQRVVIGATDSTLDPDFDSPRVFDLGLRGRAVNHKTGTVSLELATDEALLMDKRRLAATADSGARAFETSLRGICNWALGKIGANLLAGTADASIPAAWDSANLILDPRYTRTDPTQWSQANVTTVVDNTFPGPINGIAHTGIHLSQPSSTDGYVNVGATSGLAFSMQVGKTYVFSATGSVRSVIGGTGPSEVDAAYGTVLPRQRALVVHATGPGFSPSYKVWHSPQVQNVAQSGASAGFRVSVKFTVPQGSQHVFLRAYHGGTSGSITWSQFQLVEAGPGTTAEDAAYFFGSKPADGKYTYKWRESADNSVSERIANLERSPALFDWRPGQSLWEFLKPLTESAGLRLFCDEQRNWRLIDPTEYEVPGYVIAQSGHNATEGTDTISRNTEDWATGVLVTYRWTDAEGTQREAFDFAGTDDLVMRVERESEYPGPGAAAFILNSLTGRGRVQDVTVLVDYAATPTNDVSIDLPGTVKQTGKVRRVTFGLKSGLMELGTRGLIDTLPGSWAAWNPTQKWAEVNPTLKWKDA